MKRAFYTLIISLLSFFPKAQNEFITTWKPSNYSNSSLPDAPYPSSQNQVWAPFRGNNYTIYWEEVGYPSHHMTINNVTSAYQILLDFGTPLNPLPQGATYRVKVSNGNGNFQRIAFREIQGSTYLITGDIHKITEINQWGTIAFTSMNNAFHSCRFLQITATDSPNLSNVTDMSHMFENCETLTGNSSFNNWNISSVTDLSNTFTGCLLFNQPIGNWNTSNVQNMRGTFTMAQNFNQPIGNWNTSQVITMESMFNTAKSFNQPIGNWNMANVQNVKYMFSNAWAFNQPLANWNISQITSLEGMFAFAKAFNQPIESWNTSSITDLRTMFINATAFNQPLGSWNTSNVTLSNGMFAGASAFNQPLGSWDTSNITNIQNMFNGATGFNQNLGSWNLSSLTLGEMMFFNSGLNCQNYDSTLYGWSQNPATPNNISIANASPLKYTHPAAVAARNQLITAKGWTVSGDVYNANCESNLSLSETRFKNEFLIYPNPASDFIYLQNSKNIETYIIFDSSGRIVLQGKFIENKIDIRNLSIGIYTLQLNQKDSLKNFKFVKK
ncbi:BspA family leucine-rich repeat surface protein [Chryseobacterium sp. 2R14A]|uniref:BspA family leucine-rich repeat surface protein n=1 Tax=Chryseobacterium sp. 2R14A TaxID=3380353 RepID=UPI003CF45234